MSGYRSHSPEKIQEAIEKGLEVWELDTFGDGKDDHLIGERAKVEKDILDHFELAKMPSHWMLTRVYD